MMILNVAFKTNLCRSRANSRSWRKNSAKNYGRRTAKSPLNREHPDQLFLGAAHAQNQQVQRKEDEGGPEETEEYPEERELGRRSELTNFIMSRFDNKILNIIQETNNYIPSDYAKFAQNVVSAYQNEDKNAVLIIKSEIVLIERSLLAVGFSNDKPFCLLGGLGGFFLPLLGKKFLDASRPAIGTPLNGAISIAKELYNDLL